MFSPTRVKKFPEESRILWVKGGGTVEEWQRTIQRLIDWVDAHAKENPTLAEIARQVGYSPWYCSEQFHRVTGMTLREYIAGRRLTMAASCLRDTRCPIVDVALECGFSSQSAFTTAFKAAFGCSPRRYRDHPTPIPLTVRKVVLTSSTITERTDTMSNLTEPNIRVEFIPAHSYLGCYGPSTTAQGELWPGHDCDLLAGIVQSFTEGDLVIAPHTAGWTWENGERRYFYGSGTAPDYTGPVPEGFELRGPFPGSYYLVFSHPPFVYPDENAEVMKRVEDLAWNFDPSKLGFAWNEEVCQDYQRHYSEVIGYQVLRPVKKL